MPTLRTRPAAENLASRLRQVRQVSRVQRDTSGGAARELILVAFAVPVLALAVIVVGLLAVLLMADSSLSGMASAIGSVWLAIHQVPVTLTGVTVGVLPLLPTILIALTTAFFAGSATQGKRGLSELLAVALAAIAGPMLVTAMALAVVMDGASVMPLQSPNPLQAFAYTLGIHAVAAGVAIGWRRRADVLASSAVTIGDLRGLRYGLIAVLALLAAASLLVTVRLVMNFGLVGDLIGAGNGFDGYLGMTVMSLLYLPNVIVGAAGVLVGADARIGLVQVDLFSVTPGALPPLPVLGVMPSEGVGSLGALGLLVPAAIGVLVGWRCRSADTLTHIRAVGVAAGIAALAMVLLTGLAGGELGEFGDAGLTVAAVGVYTAGWIAIVGLVMALIYTALPSTRAARLRGDELGESVGDQDFDDDYLADDYLADEYLDGDLLEDDEYGDGYGEDAYGDDEYGDEEYGDEEIEADSDHADSDYETADHADGGYETAEYGDTQYGDTQYGDTRYGDTQYGDGSQYGDTQRSGADFPASDLPDDTADSVWRPPARNRVITD